MASTARGVLLRIASCAAVLFGLVVCCLLFSGTAYAQEANLLVSKDAPASALANTDITYTLTVHNIGPDDATAVNLDDDIPSPTTFVSVSQNSGPSFLCGGPAVGASTGTVSCQGVTLASGADAVFS